ncbi:MAG: PKD domain-containing protein [Candidatus Bipolaricaulota bacterium]|nr:PKD domain-containing protein [Candidatus Bipolaricaulota bacterium]
MKRIQWLLVLPLALALGGCLGPAGALRAALSVSPAQGPYPLAVTFDARGSAGEIVEYLWVFGDGATRAGPEPVVEHTYAARGTYEAYLTVVGRGGETDQARASVRVHSQRPLARFNVSPASDVRVGMTVTFDAGASSDPDGTVAEYRWDFGDGTREGTSSPEVVHIYREPGVYSVSLVVVDGEGDESLPAIRPVAVSPGGCCGK